MTINQIINGKDDFPGLIPLIFQYLKNINLDVDTYFAIMQYLKLIQKRATGEIMTLAKWMREFVTQHPAYKKDSIVGQEIAYDMLMTMNRLQRKDIHCSERLGSFKAEMKLHQTKIESESNGISDTEPEAKIYIGKPKKSRSGLVMMENGKT